ncbi:DUF433 domain-containing protein [Microvirga sp. Mcv34]|uniref:DUF433 domain-containing protein n=1 Tax=Microvirga sp. Mcv34 TaxID=2926016 RepID=UPI0021C798FA|nr:DUF433 domain-containing protein [Microvirga sp. Mcv34]
MKVDDAIVSDPEILGGMPVIKGTRVPVYDLAASIKAGISRDRILAAYPTIQEHHLDLAEAYVRANPLEQQHRRWPPLGNGTLASYGHVTRKRNDT